MRLTAFGASIPWQSPSLLSLPLITAYLIYYSMGHIPSKRYYLYHIVFMEYNMSYITNNL